MPVFIVEFDDILYTAGRNVTRNFATKIQDCVEGGVGETLPHFFSLLSSALASSMSPTPMFFPHIAIPYERTHAHRTQMKYHIYYFPMPKYFIPAASTSFLS